MPHLPVTATLNADTTPAAKPEVSFTGSGPTHVDLAWSYADTDSTRSVLEVSALLLRPGASL